MKMAAVIGGLFFLVGAFLVLIGPWGPCGPGLEGLLGFGIGSLGMAIVGVAAIIQYFKPPR